jgi:hypothetical protein
MKVDTDPPFQSSKFLFFKYEATVIVNRPKMSLLLFTFLFALAYSGFFYNSGVSVLVAGIQSLTEIL